MALVLAFGQGRGLMPLTADRASSAVPFAGTYRLIDFALSNLVNGGVRKIAVLTQYKSHSLNRHIAQAWQLSPMVGDGIMMVPAQMRVGPRWFTGSADAVYQNVHMLREARPDHVFVLPSDHVYRMDARQLLEQHKASGASATVVAVRVPVERASRLAVLDLDRHGRARGLRIVPADPPPRPDAPRHVWAWTGMCVFEARALQEVVTRDAMRPWSRHDLGECVLAPMAERGEVAVHDLAANQVPGATARDQGYWREVGELESYFDASMDLVAPEPGFNLYNRAWPIYGWQPQPLPPATFTFSGVGARGQAVESLVSPGVIVDGGTVRRSILSPDVVVHESALVEDCILMNRVEVGRGAILTRAIVDKDVRIPPGFRLGGEGGSDRDRFHVSSSGIVAIGKRQSLAFEPAAVPSTRGVA
jgi:glucose-1-phosphate adenylyltransferase